jgi:hypothetical protein
MWFLGGWGDDLVVEHLPSKNKAMSSNPRTTQIQNNNNKKKHAHME